MSDFDEMAWQAEQEVSDLREKLKAATERAEAAEREVRRWESAASCVSPEALASLLAKLQDFTPLLEQARRVEKARAEGYERGKAEWYAYGYENGQRDAKEGSNNADR